MRYKVTLFVLVAFTLMSANIFTPTAHADTVHTGIKAESILPTAGAATVMK